MQSFSIENFEGKSYYSLALGMSVLYRDPIYKSFMCLYYLQINIFLTGSIEYKEKSHILLLKATKS